MTSNDTTGNDLNFDHRELTNDQLSQVVGGDCYMHNMTNSSSSVRDGGGSVGSGPPSGQPIYEKTLALLHGAMGA